MPEIRPKIPEIRSKSCKREFAPLGEAYEKGRSLSLIVNKDWSLGRQSLLVGRVPTRNPTMTSVDLSPRWTARDEGGAGG